ncbi:MAG: GntR family transcriptional regulator [Oscillospiraceae bacterium]|nr:GntR family transcriptional regulator [Oscillospiraceae bacterium]
MSWEMTTDRPIYIQLVDEIKLRIITGFYKPGENIPTVRELAAEAEVNPNTMQRALSELEESELIITHRTTGRTVTESTELITNTKKTIAKDVVLRFLTKMQTLGFQKNEAIQFAVKEINENE